MTAAEIHRKIPKCPYCDFMVEDREKQKEHLIKEHRNEVVEIAQRYNQTMYWAAGEIAFSLFE